VEGKWEGREGRAADAMVGGSQAADTICQVLGGGSLKKLWRKKENRALGLSKVGTCGQGRKLTGNKIEFVYCLILPSTPPASYNRETGSSIS
jgi:hypothetical protein